MKRIVMCLLLTILVTGSIFAQVTQDGKGHTQAREFSLSAGGRIFYNGMFDIWERGGYIYYGSDPYAGILAILENNLYSNNGFGISGFFDATYAEIGIDFIFGSFKPNDREYTGDFKLKSTQFGFTILGKFPFVLGPLTVFPLAGIDYQILLFGIPEGHPDASVYMPKDLFDAFSLVVGAGLDYNITTKLYLRGEVLLNFKMESESDKVLKSLLKGTDVSFSLFTFGPRVSIGVGYKFGNFGKNN
jgi:opacity protein-like surface antigen